METEIDRLETEKASLEEALSSGLLSSDEIVEKSKRLNTVNSELDAKSDRWLELSEIADN